MSKPPDDWALFLRDCEKTWPKHYKWMRDRLAVAAVSEMQLDGYRSVLAGIAHPEKLGALLASVKKFDADVENEVVNSVAEVSAVAVLVAYRALFNEGEASDG